MTPEQALQNLHNGCETLQLDGKTRDALRQCTQTIEAFISHAREIEKELKELKELKSVREVA